MFVRVLLIFSVVIFSGCGETVEYTNNNDESVESDECVFGSPGCVCGLTEDGAVEAGRAEDAACLIAENDNGYCLCRLTTTNPPNVTSPPNGAGGYKFVLIEDIGAAGGGENPGADIDAVGVVKNGIERFATSVEEDNVNHRGLHLDTTEILGAPDSECEAQSFVSLGGVENSGYVIVGFSDAGTDFSFGPGDIIHVYELGPSTCSNQPNWLDDPYTVSVSVGNSKDQFTAAGATVASGTNAFIVP